MARHTVVDYHRSIADLAPDLHFWTDHARGRGDAHLSVARVVGHDDSGGPFEIAFVTIGVVAQSDARGEYIEVYEVSDLTAALERFDQFATEHDREHDAPSI